jgi:hypothetical protein
MNKKDAKSKDAPEVDPTVGASPTIVASSVVADAAARPACDATTDATLVYVTAEKAFYACANGQWSAIDLKGTVGQAGDAGMTIRSIERLDAMGDDLCTRYTNIKCTFRGGMFITYSTGMKYFTGGVTVFADYPVTGTGVDANQSDSDTFSSDGQMYAPSSGKYLTTLTRLARVGGDDEKPLWLVLDYDTDALSLVFDTNDNGSLDAADEVVATLTKTKIF